MRGLSLVIAVSVLWFACGGDDAVIVGTDIGVIDVVTVEDVEFDDVGDDIYDVEIGLDDAVVDDLAALDEGGDLIAEDLGQDVGGGDDGSSDVFVDIAMDEGTVDAWTMQSSMPDERGPYETIVTSDYVDRGSRRTPVESHVPQGDVGQHFPLVVFVPGFQMTCEQFSNHCDELASHGFVVICAEPDDSILSISHVEMALDVVGIVDFSLTGDLATVVDPDRIGMAGHSLGGKVSVMAAYRDSRVSAVFAMDPVNGGSTITGYSEKLPDIVPGEVSPLAIAFGFVGETTNGEGSFLSPACAPLDQNFQTFYDAATSATWRAKWEFTGADHMDFIDYEISCGILCETCPDGTAELRTVSRGTRTLLSAFFMLHFNDDSSMDSWLTGADVPEGIIVN